LVAAKLGNQSADFLFGRRSGSRWELVRQITDRLPIRHKLPHAVERLFRGASESSPAGSQLVCREGNVWAWLIEGSDIPQKRGRIAAGRGQEAAVRGKAHGVNMGLVARQR